MTFLLVHNRGDGNRCCIRCHICMRRRIGGKRGYTLELSFARERIIAPKMIGVGTPWSAKYRVENPNDDEEKYDTQDGTCDGSYIDKPGFLCGTGGGGTVIWVIRGCRCRIWECCRV